MKKIVFLMLGFAFMVFLVGYSNMVFAKDTSQKKSPEKKSEKSKDAGLTQEYFMSLCLKLLMKAGVQNDEIEGKLERIGGTDEESFYEIRYPSIFTGIVVYPEKMKGYGFREVTEGDKVKVKDLGNQKYRVNVRILGTDESKIIDLSSN